MKKIFVVYEVECLDGKKYAIYDTVRTRTYFYRQGYEACCLFSRRNDAIRFVRQLNDYYALNGIYHFSEVTQ